MVDYRIIYTPFRQERPHGRDRVVAPTKKVLTYLYISLYITHLISFKPVKSQENPEQYESNI